VNIQPGWEGLVYGVLIAAGVAFVLATIGVAFGLRAVVRIVRPTTALGIWPCIPIAAIVVVATTAGYFEVKHLQHPTGRHREVAPAPSAAGGPPSHTSTFPIPIVAVSSGPIGDLVVTVQVPTCGFNPSVGTVFSSSETLDIQLSPNVELPPGAEDLVATCDTRTQDVSIGRMPTRPGMTLTGGQQVFVLGVDGTWTQRLG
jgi:hypothetical protein